jgi:lipoprotein-releasing system permease protein
MNLPLFIAKRLIRGRSKGTSFSRPINVIAVTGIAAGLAVMIIAVATLSGFKMEIREKIVGFAAHILVRNYDSNYSFELTPISTRLSFIPDIKKIPGVVHLEGFATKAGIIKTEDDIQGVVLKGIGTDFDWTYFRRNMAEGSEFILSDTSTTNDVVISKKLASLLRLKTGDSFAMHFVQDPPRMRKFRISGLYETSLEEFDRIYVFCDIRHIRRLNGWDEDQVSGIEIFIDDFNRLEEITGRVNDAIGYKLSEKEPSATADSVKERYPQIFDWLNFQDMNVVIIIVLMLVVAGFNMISGLIILILEKTNMIGVMKALGSEDKLIRNVFLYQAAWLIGKGLFWGNIIGAGLAILQLKTGFISLDPSSYYLKTVPVNLDIIHILLLNAGTMAIIIMMLLVPSHLVSRISPVKAIRFD